MTATEIGAQIATYAPMVIAAASAAASVLPQPKSEPWATMRKILDWAALNIGNAKNAPKP